MDCQHPVTVKVPAGRRCLDCGDTITPAGESMPSMFPEATRAEGIATATRRRDAARMLQRSLFAPEESKR